MIVLYAARTFILILYVRAARKWRFPTDTSKNGTGRRFGFNAASLSMLYTRASLCVMADAAEAVIHRRCVPGQWAACVAAPSAYAYFTGSIIFMSRGCERSRREHGGSYGQLQLAGRRAALACL